ncbi:cytochrome bd-I ubiquinol oxidase subunit 2 apoprotein [Roseibium hamelinense]|uniref:Cytochrome bd-I ubiquinol oxidase subunit 2 apoprotein n=1 Tax=Roseibium hamelinense TaxID=150831 RepID=A0A562TH26_9HYPH|nr:cytochrome d ubiquinol oxidase subunit II [Roseibium hamelinense]MTI45867.1 cytochrome d ubiquinol oxidase subunit II [Roseibium hamelinense]TWI92949.1 cytochrome bd-I ubiquinol oxidase subunit 2 apoprotein [Roseibium hamelinense]
MELFGDPTVWLPLAFAALMGVSILVYVILDGFDLGVGILFPMASADEKDRMVAAIGPFWDANETWLVLAVGLLLVAFPAAHGTILTALYLPVAVMLIGLILRGVAFEFRAKTTGVHKERWNLAFFSGSLSASLAQGYMLGIYIMGLQQTPMTVGFGILTAICLTAGYGFIGATWLIIKTEGALQLKAVSWARRRLWGVMIGLGAISLASPFVSERIFEKWFSFPSIILLAPLPLMSALLVFILWTALKHLPAKEDRWNWVPFSATAILFCLAFAGLAYSFYPYVVPEQLTLYESASAPESLFIILLGALFVLPVIIGYTILAYTVFRGKATELRYD